MSKKRYEIQSACPQCGCSAVSHLSHEEMVARYGEVPNVEMECKACMIKYTAKMSDACPEWDKECQLKS